MSLFAVLLALLVLAVGFEGVSADKNAGTKPKKLFSKKATAGGGGANAGKAGDAAAASSGSAPAANAAPEVTKQEAAVNAGMSATGDVAAPKVVQQDLPPRPRALHKIPDKFASRGRNLAGIGPEDRHRHCDEVECPVGACTFVDCENSVSCRGGGCTFYRCKAPTCPGGACKFIECEDPTCPGGACDFIESTGIRFESNAHCTGGACTIEGAQHVGNPVGDAVCE